MAGVFVVGALVAGGACGHIDQKVDPPRSGAVHSADAAAQAGAESATPTARAQSVIISGRVMDCLMPGQQYDVQAFPVKAFDPASNGKLVGLLRSRDTLTFFTGPPASRARANSEYYQLKSLFTTATALALDSTSSTGRYSLTVPSMDSVLVFGFDEREDMPEYYLYRIVGGRSNVSALFDMAGGGCGPVSDTTKGR